jgi:hypothetical protein
MKTVSFVILLLSMHTSAQLYERTGKNLGFYLSGNTSLHSSFSEESIEFANNGGSMGLTHMLLPGIYPKLGYSYSLVKTSFDRAEQMDRFETHGIEASVLFDKRLCKLVNGRFVRNACHYVSIGMIGAPEIRVQLSSAQEVFRRFETTALLGLSLTHITKNRGRASMARTRQFDFYVRRGLTPAARFVINNETLDYKRLEVGVQLRCVFHQVNSFVPQRGRRR